MAKRTDTRPRRRPLNKDRVIRAAIELADAEGIEALSMRRLAKALGVEAMSLYNHVANKDEILAGITDAVASEIELPDGDVDWRTAIRRSAISARDVHVRHPWASGLSMSRQSGGPAMLRRSDWLLRTLREAGFPPDVVYHALHILEAYVLGFTVMHQSFPYRGEELAGLVDGFLRQLSEDQYPDLVDHVRQHLEPRAGEEGGFELGLDLLLDGLEQGCRTRRPSGARRRSGTTRRPRV
jgi:AcrR family transcriptional regulator